MYYWILLVILLVAYFVAGHIARNWQRGPARYITKDLTGQIILITGGNAGIGKETVRVLAKYNATIIMACRSELKAQKLIMKIKQESGNQSIFFMKLDLSDLTSVRQFANEFRRRFNRLNILINNAGVGFTLPKIDKQGHDLCFLTNHLGHFLLTYHLIDIIMQTKQSRVINVSSYAHTLVKQPINWDDAYKGKYTKYLGQYNASKYANVVFTHELQNIFDRYKVECKAVSLHPGFIATGLATKSDPDIFMRLAYYAVRVFALNEREGAWTSIYTALELFEDLVPSGYYERNQLSKCSKLVIDGGQIGQLWAYSEKALGLKPLYQQPQEQKKEIKEELIPS